ncbi:hypothetical protein PR048_002537 [Dryococelus australis]|uniref:PiggyBac transposable element-derived protein domain-containing protein n=1 Tax=Dryococelus australis TaxID=614101 RepID=A0ABQ9IKK1_9NEOP|nr:hypothetical protein PR048_002537 [Dryococelus australis]
MENPQEESNMIQDDTDEELQSNSSHNYYTRKDKVTKWKKTRHARQILDELWCSDGDGVERFLLVMSLKRFKFLLRCIRFDDKKISEEIRQ